MFPSLKDRRILRLDGIVKYDVIPTKDIQEHCLNKQSKIYLTQSEISKLIVEGRTQIECGLTIIAEYPNESVIFRKVQREHQLLEDYKQKVRDAIKKYRDITRMLSEESSLEIKRLDELEKELEL